MARVVAVSNRVADPRKAAAGGLAVALGESLNATGGVWMGWSGRIVEAAEGGRPGEGELKVQQAGDVTLATLDLSREDHDTYYLGYANRVLWPVFHYRLDLADFNTAYLAGYRRVNQLFARKLLPLLRPDDLVWIHDYHLIPLAAELRALGSTHRIGFFLHIPLPPPLILAALPGHEWLIRALFAYDVVGFQSEADASHFSRYVQSEANAEVVGPDLYRAFGRTVLAKAFPIGIDVDEFAALTHGKEARQTYETMREQYSRRQLLVGIDRLDYSKGLPHRIRAFQELLATYPESRRSATLIQIASPTREDVDAYMDIRRELEHLCGQINGDYGELDWMPVRYIHRTLARKRLPGLCRAARVVLVTPLRDGMNLVAKEYIAAQDPGDPGVLVLSRFAGAAEQLREALLVNGPPDSQRPARRRAFCMDSTTTFEAWWAGLGVAATTGLRILAIAGAAWLLIVVLQRLIRGFRMRLSAHMHDREQIKRAETLGRVFRYLVAVVVSAIAIMLILAELGVSVAPILGAAGVVGLAVGFGAQSLAKDYFTGFFILLENQIRQGDVVQLGDHGGLVEEVTLRYVQLRDYDGNVHFVPNSEIRTVINMSRGYAQAVVDASVAYREDVDEVIDVMKAVGAELRNDPGFSSRILADLEMAGVERWDDSAVVIRCRFKTAPLEQWNVKREFLRRLKKAFDARGIEIPYPHLTVYAGQDKDGRAPAFAVRSLNAAAPAEAGIAPSVRH